MTLSPLPLTAGLAAYDAQVDQLLAAFERGDRAAMQQVHQGHPGWWRLSPQEFLQKRVDRTAIANTVAWYYAFDTWTALETWVTAVLPSGSETAQFEAAADAVVQGDTDTLRAIIATNPAIVHTRSMRAHHAQLLHYAGANGVENYRQISPSNITTITQLLLVAGADVDALADMYGGSTTLGLVATSIHPAQAGVLIPLLDLLLTAGATIDHPQASGNGQGVVLGCLHNGRPEAAHYLAGRGALLNLEAASGVGRLDRVQAFFTTPGQLAEGATLHQLQLGFSWACAYDHAPVVEYLLQQGALPDAYTHGLPGLHWAIIGNHPEVIELLVSRGTSMATRNHYGGNAIGCTLWAIGNSSEVYRWPAKTVDHLATIRYLLQQGAPVDPGTVTWLQQESGFAPASLEQLDQLFRQYGTTT
ncbi:ankyrin repeat domain-containing protein [Paraflavitalea pollutisoli]|uniref:ankyrin repeat domain-containing protein n=1 Tax=Paraflavitalea pollutisoli TaxID=3034143 RepID=UPI0023EB2454|nr:ankyrin repeat domain-containing protein [Paraflavitalea sp. H1-2-19X]